MKVCIVPGCHELTDKTRCPAHTRTRDKARGTRQQRGYGKEHEQRRAKDKPRVDAGLAVCWRCGQRISPLEPWDEGHDDLDRTVWRGPEHRACNRGHKAPTGVGGDPKTTPPQDSG